MKLSQRYSLHSLLQLFCVLGLAWLTSTACTRPPSAPSIAVLFSSAFNPIYTGESVNLSWAITFPDNGTNETASINQGIGNISTPSGSTSVSPSSTKTYTLTATAVVDGQTIQAAKDVVITVTTPTVTANFNANPVSIEEGDSTTLNWSISYPARATNSSASINTGIGSISASGNRIVSPGATTTYTLTANATVLGQVLTTQQQVTVNVVPPLDPGTLPNPEEAATPSNPTSDNFYDSNQFLIDPTGQPLQANVQPGAIEEARAAVVKGSVTDRAGTPISGVRIEIKDQPDLGYTVTRTDGKFDFMLNGGGSWVVQYSKPNYFAVQRLVDTNSHDFSVLEKVVMIGQDTVVTQISSASSSMTVAQSSVSTDTDGTRRARLLFPAGTTATLHLPNGTPQALSTYHVRATEYTVGSSGPSAMPASLPPQSGYTYAVELSLDEAVSAKAKSVTFNKAIPIFIDNFIGFEAGTVAPVGWYDEESASWVPSEDGRIIKILSYANNQAVLDVTGSGSPATQNQLNTLGITSAELTQLATLYPGAVGKTLTRIQVDHFTPIDINWPIAPEEGSTPPPGMDELTDGDENPEGDDIDCGSIIECQSQVLGESVSVVGTPYSLNYRSSRVIGRGKNRFSLTVTGADPLPPNLNSIGLTIEVAGRKIVRSFSTDPDQRTSFTWDGNDAYGRKVYGAVKAKVTLQYNYAARYVPSTSFLNGTAFGMPSPTPEQSLALARSGVTSPLTSHGTYTLLANPVETQMGAWTLSPAHYYSQSEGKLYKGDGTTQGAQFSSQAGVSASNFLTFENSWLSSGEFDYIAADKQNNFYFSSSSTVDATVFKRDNAGTVTRIVGGGNIAINNANGAAATSVSIIPHKLHFGGPGNALYFTARGRYNNSTSLDCDYLFRLEQDGTLTNVLQQSTDSALTCTPTNQNSLIVDFAVAMDGSAYLLHCLQKNFSGTSCEASSPSIEDSNYTISKVLPSGVSQRYAESITKEIPWILDIDVDADQNLYILDEYSIVRILTDGTVEVMAGVPSTDYCTSAAECRYVDGTDSTNVRPLIGLVASLAGNSAVIEVTDEGGIFFNSTQDIHYISTDKKMYHISGNGADFCQNNYNGTYFTGPAMQTCIQMGDMVLGADGSLYVTALTNGGFLNYVKNDVIRIGNAVNFQQEFNRIPDRDNDQIYIFDEEGKHQSTVSKLTGATLYTFSYENGYLSAITDGNGNTTEIVRNGSNIDIIAPFGQTTSIALDGEGYLESITNPANESYQATYHPGTGLLASFQDPNQNPPSTIDYLDGLLALDVNAEGGSLSFDRNRITGGFEVTKTSAQDRQTQYTVKMMRNGNQESSVINPDGSASSELANEGIITQTSTDGTVTKQQLAADPRFGMASPFVASTEIKTPSEKTLAQSVTKQVTLAVPSDPYSNIVSAITTTNTNGNTTTASYSAATNTLNNTTAEGRNTELVYDNLARVKEIQLPGIVPRVNTYDTQGRLSNTSQQANGVTRQTIYEYYPSTGYLKKTTDSLGQWAEFQAYDDAGRFHTIAYSDGRIISFDYDANGNMTMLTPPSQPAHYFDYTAIDQLDLYRPPTNSLSESLTDYDYSFDRELEMVKRPDNINVDYQYHPTTGALNAVRWGSQQFGLTYNPTTGQVSTISSPYGVDLNLSYDGSLPTSETWSGEISAQVNHHYNNNFLLESNDINGQHAISYGYDRDGLLTSAGNLTLVREQTTGMLRSTTFSAVSTTLDYNGFGEVDHYSAQTSSTTLLDIDYHDRDALGRITDITETINAGSSTTKTYRYDYDAVGRLWKVSVNNALTSEYLYDDNGNRTVVNGPIVQYDDQDRLTQYGTVIYGYTNNGELDTQTDTANGNVTQYDYDPFGNLTHVQLPNGTQIDYVIDGKNRRVGKKVNTTLTQGFIYQDQLNPIAELDGSGNVLSRFIYTGQSYVPSYMKKGSINYRIISDHLGSVRLVVDSSTGAIVQRMDYDEWGKVTLDTNPGFQPFGYAGGIYDRDTKLVRFGARDYDASIGRWTAKDPIRFNGGGSNLYAYVNGNPVNYSDPKGLCGPLTPLCAGLIMYGPELTAVTIIGAEIASGVPNPVSSVSFGGRVAGEAIYDVYLGMKNGAPAYVGISKNVSARECQHGDRFDDILVLTGSGLTKDQSRAVEQSLINQNPSFENIINSISPNRSWYQDAVDWGTQWLTNNGFN